MAAPSAAGLLGLLVAPASVPWLWAVLLGLGTAGAFPLALTLVLMRSESSAQAARISAAAQGIGYVVASSGPFMVGVLHEATAGWAAPLMLLLALLVGQVLVDRIAARDRLVIG